VRDRLDAEKRTFEKATAGGVSASELAEVGVSSLFISILREDTRIDSGYQRTKEEASIARFSDSFLRVSSSGPDDNPCKRSSRRAIYSSIQPFCSLALPEATARVGKILLSDLPVRLIAAGMISGTRIVSSRCECQPATTNLPRTALLIYNPGAFAGG